MMTTSTKRTSPFPIERGNSAAPDAPPAEPDTKPEPLRVEPPRPSTPFSPPDPDKLPDRCPSIEPGKSFPACVQAKSS
jgi:hypothetical protein